MNRKFNLQPWRQKLKEKQNKDFKTITAVVFAVVALGVFGWHMKLKNDISDQESAIKKYDTEIQKHEKAKNEISKIKKFNEILEEQVSTISRLESERDLSLKILTFLAQKTPEGVFLDEVTFKNKQLTLIGTAENELGISEYIRQLEQSPLFTNVGLSYITQAKDNARYTVGTDTSVKVFSIIALVKVDDPSVNKGGKK